VAKSLRDQLIKSGAANADSSSKRGKKRKQPKAAKKDRAPGSMTAGSTAPDAGQRRAQEQAQRDRELNRQHQQKREAREVAAQIRQLIERNRITVDRAKGPQQKDGEVDSDHPTADGKDAGTLDYNFTDASVVRRINLPVPLHRRVVAGTVAIARLDDRYHLIPRPVADKICQRDDSSIVVLNDDQDDSDSSAAVDDEYAQFEIPDDLMW